MSDAKKHGPFRTILILGAPGSGKGTQGKVLGSIPRFHHLACGDVFRSLDTRTTLGQEFVRYASKGQLMPDDLTVQLWGANVHHRVESRIFKPDIDFLVLDGIPRNVEQAKLLEEEIDVIKLFHLSCPNRDELSRRLRKVVDEVKAFEADIAVVIAYGQILSKAVLEAPRLGCINVHASLLPKYRGAAPIQAAIREGDAETGVTIMFMDEGLDTGDILLMERLPIAPDETGGSLHDRLALAAPAALERALDRISVGNPPRTPQDNTQASHVGKLTREHGHLDWSRSAVEIERLVRAYTPWPGTFTKLPDGAPLKVHATRVVPEAEVCPVGGTVVGADPRNGLIVACGQGLLEILDVQAEGRKRMSAADFLRGHALPVGSRLV